MSVSWLRSALGPSRVVSPEVLHFIVFTGHLLLAAHADLFGFALAFSDFKLARLLEKTLGSDFENVFYLVRLTSNESTLSIAVSHGVSMASPATQFRRSCWVVVLSISSIISIVASVRVVSVATVVGCVGIVSSAAVVGAVLVVVVVAVSLAVSTWPGVFGSSRLFVVDSKVVFALSRWSNSCGCCRRSCSCSCCSGCCGGLLRVKQI